MPWFRATALAFCLSLALFPGSARAQEGRAGPNDVAFVSHLLALGQPALAQRELERLSAIDPDWAPSPDQAEAWALALWEGGLPGAAEEWLGRALRMDGASEALRARAQLRLATWLIARGALDAAQVELGRLMAFGAPDARLKAEAQSLTCILLVLRQAGAQAQACLVQSGAWAALPTETQAEATRLIRRLDARRGWIPLAAAASSALVPGLGQSLSGEVGEGLSAAGLNALWVLGAIALTRRGLVLEAGLVVVGYGGRLYITNIKNAYGHARVAQDRRRREAAAQLFDLLAAASP